MEVKNIEINGFDVWDRIGAKGADHKGFIIAWQANIGWGELSVYGKLSRKPTTLVVGMKAY